MSNEPEIKSLTVLSLCPGDTLVVEVPDLTIEGSESIKRMVQSQIPAGVPVIVTSPGVEFTVIRAEASAVPRPKEATA